jgi:hypothetical protein
MVYKNYILILILLSNIWNIYGIKFMFSTYFGKNNYKYRVKLSICPKEYQRFQWKLFEKSFNGTWCSPYTYIYNTNSEITNILPKTKHELTFYPNRTCSLNGSGLRFSENKVLYYNESNFNKYDMMFLFPECGGHSSRYFDKSLNNSNKLMPIEVNFFHNNIRSMIVIYYKACNKSIVLDSIQVTPFRNLRENKTYPTISSAPILYSVNDVVQHLLNNNWYGERLFYDTGKQYFNKMILNAFNLFPYLSPDKNLVKATFEDGLIIIVPKVLPIERHFKLVFGAMMNKKLYKQLIINYNIDGNLTRWLYDTYTLPP